MTTASYTEKHLHAISVVEADPAILNRESAVRRILHALQENAIDYGESRGTTHLPAGLSLIEVGACKRANAFRAVVRLRESGWIREATVRTKLGGRTRGFLVALHESAGLGTELDESKIRDVGAEMDGERAESLVQCRSNIGPIRVQGRSNVESNKGPRKVQGRSNVGSAPEPISEGQTSIEFNNKYVRTTRTRATQTELDMAHRPARKRVLSANGKLSPLMALAPERRDELLAIAEVVSEHDVRRYSEHSRFDPAYKRVADKPELIAEALLRLEEISKPQCDRQLRDRARGIVEFRWGNAKGVGDWADDQWEYWDNMWAIKNIDKVWEFMNKKKNRKYEYFGMGSTMSEAKDNARMRIMAETGRTNPHSGSMEDDLNELCFHEMK